MSETLSVTDSLTGVLSGFSLTTFIDFDSILSIAHSQLSIRLTDLILINGTGLHQNSKRQRALPKSTLLGLRDSL